MPHEYVDAYAERRRINEASKEWSFNDGLPWSDDEVEFLTLFWVNIEAKYRDEADVSRWLGRTIESCRVKAEHLRKQMGTARPSPSAPARSENVAVCQFCMSDLEDGHHVWCPITSQPIE